MKPVVMVMSVVEVNGKQSVQCTIGLGDGKTFSYLGSINCDFEQFGKVNAWLRMIPKAFFDYRNDKWTAYLDNLMEELASL